MVITINPLIPEDYRSAIDVIKRSIIISQGKLYPKVLIDEFCKKYNLENFKKKAEEIEYFVAKGSNNRIVGVIGLKHNELRTFFVDPDYQGKGIGSKLYTYLEGKARSKGLTKIVLEGSPLGEPIYLKFGFKKVRSIYKEKEGVRYTDAYMEKELT